MVVADDAVTQLYDITIIQGEWIVSFFAEGLNENYTLRCCCSCVCGRKGERKILKAFHFPSKENK